MFHRLVQVSLAVVAVLPLSACHQGTIGTIDRLIIGEALANSEFAQNLRALCLPGGRLSGSENGHVAERYVAEKLRQYGVRNVRLEPFEMPGWQSHETTVTVLTEPAVVLDGAVALWNSLSTPAEGTAAELVDAGEGSEEDFGRVGGEARGKFVLVRDERGKRADKMGLAREHEAAGLIVVGRANREPIIGYCHAEPRREPGVVIRHDDGQRLAEKVAAGESVRVNVRVRAEVWTGRPNNVVGEVPGRGALAREVIVLCAHLDSWHLAEGAIDNGNGSATILEVARALAAVGWQPRRTVRFVWFMGEEQDLNGSRAYVARHADELRRITAVINVDMPGSPRKLATSGPPELAEFLRGYARRLAGFEIDAEIGTLRAGSSDHSPFLEAGVATIALWGEIGPGGAHYHTVGDKYEVVDRRGTVQSVAALAVLVRELADRAAR